jgi:hypothetical protein
MTVAGRIVITDHHLKIGDGLAQFPIMQLQGWGPWSGVGTALLRLDPPATEAELAAVAEVPRTEAGRNGLAEMRSFLETHQRPGGPTG